jgi:hypothetical protein
MLLLVQVARRSHLGPRYTSSNHCVCPKHYFHSSLVERNNCEAHDTEVKRIIEGLRQESWQEKFRNSREIWWAYERLWLLRFRQMHVFSWAKSWKATYVCTAENRDTIRVSALKPQSPKDAIGEATELQRKSSRTSPRNKASSRWNSVQSCDRLGTNLKHVRVVNVTVGNPDRNQQWDIEKISPWLKSRPGTWEGRLSPVH